MKRKVSILLMALLTVLFCSCSKDEVQNSPTTNPTATLQPTITTTEQPTPTLTPEDQQELQDAVIKAQMEADLTISMIDNESIERVREAVWYEYVQNEVTEETRLQEIDDRAMTFGEVSMKYGVQVIGEADENGYPLFIALHGGGSSDTPDINNQQWAAMATYYRSSIKQGVYVNPRGVRDTWDTHANPESYPLYDELIENMILFYNVDPNRVYILGYSAGGDGVYMIAPRMADRFAAANMSAGHHNGTSVINLFNTPIQLQVGIKDVSYDRNIVTAEYDELLTSLSLQYGGGYLHRTFIHALYAHNFNDNVKADQEVITNVSGWLHDNDTTTTMADTNSIRFLNQYTREPLPEKVVWDLGNRAAERDTESFYWISAPYTTNTGVIVASYSTSENKITIESTTANGDFKLWINEEMVDVFRPITIETPKGTFEVNVEPSLEVLRETTAERGDSNYQFLASVSYESLVQ